MKKMPTQILCCGQCPYFLPSRQYGEGDCSLLLVLGYNLRLYATSIPVECPLDNIIE